MQRLRRFLWETVAYRLFNLYPRIHGRTIRKVLFLSHNPLMAGYLREIWDLLANDSRITGRVCFQTPEGTPGDLARSKEILPLREVGFRRAELTRWDLVLLADHPGVFRRIATSKRQPTIRAAHGIGGKMMNQQDYQYGARSFDKDGSCIYTKILETNNERKQFATAQNPELTEIIEVVGSIRLDRIAKARKKVGPQGKKQLLVAGSWTKGNVIEAIAQSNIPASEIFPHETYQISIRLHPNLLRKTSPALRDLQAALEEWSKIPNVSICPPDKPLEADLAQADVVLGDDLTSVSLYAAALSIPIVVYETRSETSPDGSLLSTLRDTYPSSSNIGDAFALLQSEEAFRHSTKKERLRAAINSNPGKSEDRVRQTLYSELGLDPH